MEHLFILIKELSDCHIKHTDMEVFQKLEYSTQVLLSPLCSNLSDQSPSIHNTAVDHFGSGPPQVSPNQWRPVKNFFGGAGVPTDFPV